MIDPILTDLNPEQARAVAAGATNLLVLAGAGSGKTRVLVHRIAYLVQHENVSPFGILAVTFTNKAAHEMRSRIESMLRLNLFGMWVGTFHGLAHRMLRAHFEAANLPRDFQILDSDDQLRIIKRIHKNLDLDEAKWEPKQSQWFINKRKEEAKRAADVVPNDKLAQEVMLRVYLAYEKICEASGLVDFTELLFRSFELLQNHPDLSAHYQERFQHILVDEFQDTNRLQYAWLKLLKGPQSYVMAVGDDDQSIYSWRGARVENLNRFLTDFSPVETVRLEQNYRSTSTILDAANAVIAHNPDRLGKQLWTAGNQGEKITLYTAFNERDEAHYVVAQIQRWFKAGGAYADVAILYRSNAQSRIFEERLIDVGLPYRIYGGLKFFDRAEIKDALAYMRLIANRNDDAAFERIINTPTRGIGASTLMQVRETAHQNGATLWEALQHLIEHQLLSARAITATQKFIDLINQFESDSESLALHEQVQYVLDCSGLLTHYQKDKSEKGLSRVENLQELVNATKQFNPEVVEENTTPLSAFLAHVALENSENQADAHSDCMNLMTLHAAKGLEFPLVFITGLEEELFPHRNSSEDERGLQEERRLCYVGMTRAKQKLYLSHAESRRLYGYEKYHAASRFLREIPAELLDAVRPTAQVARANSFYGRNPLRQQRIEANGTQLKIGQRVQHKKFGAGIVINFEGHSEHARVQVRFDSVGMKWLVASFAKLVVL